MRNENINQPASMNGDTVPKAIYVVSDNIFSPLGATTNENFSRMREGLSGVRLHHRPEMAEQPFFAALFDKTGSFIGEEQWITGQKDVQTAQYTKFEQMLMVSVSDALLDSGVNPADKRTALIISSTKGNISLLENVDGDAALYKRINLFTSARLVAGYFHFSCDPIIVSNACISGILAILTAVRLIRSGQYDHAVITGADTISKFVLSGFDSFQAISSGICRPFDQDRDGINLGEGAGTIILSCAKKFESGLKVVSGAVSNDANHISGPSRTGEELYQVIDRSLKDAGLHPQDIGYISAHGTATSYNDEMEAKAITLANLQDVPANSLKAYLGHTLGAAGLIESIITLQSMREDMVLQSKGFETHGVTLPLNICRSNLQTPLNHCLKTASGFGGCNAALILSK